MDKKLLDLRCNESCKHLKYDQEWREYYCEVLGYFMKEIKEENIKCPLEK